MLRQDVLSVCLLMCFMSVPSAGQGLKKLALPRQEYNRLAHLYLRLVEYAVTGSLMDEAGRCRGGQDYCNPALSLPYDKNLRWKGNDHPTYGHTMVGHLRLHNIRNALVHVIRDNIAGHFAELGVWRGGASIYAKAVMEVMRADSRKVYVFDAFESINEYSSHVNASSYVDYLKVTEELVKHNFEKYGLYDDNVIFQKGLFKNTTKRFRQENPGIQLAVLRIDGNFYDSYQDVLYYMYDMVPVGGYVIFDDIMRNHPWVVECWEDFKRDQGVSEVLIDIDGNAAYFRKTKDVVVDFSKMKPPRDANLP